MTYTVLHIDSSPLGEQSVSRKLTAKVVAGLRVQHPDAKVTARDFGVSPLPHLSGVAVGAFYTPADKLTELQAGSLKASDAAVAELFAADAIVIGSPMWNFGIPSSLKAWIDHIVRAGKTFTYGAGGPESLVPPGKKVVVVSARGGIYSEGPMQGFDHQETYLRSVFSFIGLSDISFVRAEGLSMGPEALTAAVHIADEQIAATLKKVA